MSKKLNNKIYISLHVVWAHLSAIFNQLLIIFGIAKKMESNVYKLWKRLYCVQ